MHAEHAATAAISALLSPGRHSGGAAGFAQAAATALAPLFDTGRAVFVEQGAPGGGVHFVDWPTWCQPLYCQQLRVRDPIGRWLRGGGAARDGGVVRLSDLVPQRKLVRAGYFRDLLEPSGARYVLTLALPGGQGVRGTLSLVRDAGARDFDAAEQALARSLVPVLGAVCTVAAERAAWQRLQAGGALAAAAVDGEWLFAPDARGDWMPATAAASALVRRWRSADLQARGALAVQQALGGAATVDLPLAGPCDVLRLRGGVAGGLLLRPLRSASADAEAAPSLEALTPREREVAALVARGQSNKDIARALDASPWTVKNHLRAVFRKTGVHNRTGLCLLLAG